MIIIVPCAGKSKRYPNLRPKWMLTQPNGEMMVVESLKGLDIKPEDRIIISILEEHEEKYHIAEGLKKSFNRPIDVCILKESLKSQPADVYQTIQQMNLNENNPLLIKDSDNYFELMNLNEPESYVTISSLNNYSAINPRNKSYVKLDANNYITEIVEKKVISDTFSIGGYYFKLIKEFIEGFKEMYLAKEGGEFYVSDVIGLLMSKGDKFKIKEGKNYLDWGTVEEWNKYKLSQKTFIIDLDGVLVKSSAKYFQPYWGTSEGIAENIEAINKLKENGNQIIILTSRTEEYRQITEEQLKNIGLKYDSLIMNALHNQRVVINDFSSSNPFPSAMAINLERDSNRLAYFLKSMNFLKSLD